MQKVAEVCTTLFYQLVVPLYSYLNGKTVSLRVNSDYHSFLLLKSYYISHSDIFIILAYPNRIYNNFILEEVKKWNLIIVLSVYGYADFEKQEASHSKHWPRCPIKSHPTSLTLNVEPPN